MIVTPVYSAGEEPNGVDRDKLIAGVRLKGHRQVLPVDGEDGLAGLIASLAKPGDLVIGLGAGTITEWANALAGTARHAHPEARRGGMTKADLSFVICRDLRTGIVRPILSSRADAQVGCGDRFSGASLTLSSPHGSGTSPGRESGSPELCRLEHFPAKWTPVSS